MSSTEHTDIERSDLLRYRSGAMTPEERHAFERKMQGDPFSAEAEEGFSLVAPDEVSADLEMLGRRLKARTRRRSLVVYSGVAAALLLLLVTSVIFLRTGSDQAPDYSIAADEKMEVKDSITNIALGAGVPESEKAVSGDINILRPSEAAKESGMARADVNPVPTLSEDKTAARKISQETKEVEKGIMADSSADMLIKAEAAKSVAVTNVSVVPNMAEVSNIARKAVPVTKALNTLIRGIVISAEDSLPIPGAVIAVKGTDNITVTDAEGRFTLAALADTSTMLVGKFIGMNDTEVRITGDELQKITMSQSLMALDEVVVVGYGTAKRSAVSGAVSGVAISQETELTGYRSAEPVTGYPAFREYINDNIRYPEDASGGSREVVVIDLPVTREGISGTPVIVRSPGAEFSEAAIKLIREGPRWKPSSMNGVPSDDTVRIRLVFRK